MAIPDSDSVSPDDAELIFRGQRAAGKAQVVGYLMFPDGRWWRACTGSTTLQPLPTGLYLCDNFRVRGEAAMVVGGVGYSVDVTPLFPTTRTLLRIHPDGNRPGTRGCIGIVDGDQTGCRNALEFLIRSKGGVMLHVDYI